MRRMSKFVGLLEKYGNVDEDKERHLGRINWDGHIKLRGSFTGSAFISGYQHDFIATDLKSESNPRGSILQEAKNYTDSKVKHTHYIRIGNDTAEAYFTYVSEKANQYTIDTLTSSLPANARISCSGYFGNLALMYIVSDGSTLGVGAFDPANGKITPFKMVFTSIKDVVE